MKKAVCLERPNHIKYKDVKSRKLNKNEVRIEIRKIGICGSDIGIIRGLNPFVKYPIIPGHEFSGVIAELGDAVEKLQAGNKVTVMPLRSCGKCDYCKKGEVNHCHNLKILGVHINGAYATEIIVDEKLVRLLPHDMSFETAALTEPVAVAVHCVSRANIKKGDKIAILGSGTIGILITQVSLIQGASFVLMTDIINERLQIAKNLGADVVINSSQENIEKLVKEEIGEFDVVFEGVGTKRTLCQATEITKSGGTIILVAVPHSVEEVFNIKNIFGKELVLKASRVYNNEDFNRALSLLTSNEIKLERIISREYPLKEIQKALNFLEKYPGQTIKILMDPTKEK